MEKIILLTLKNCIIDLEEKKYIVDLNEKTIIDLNEKL